MVEGSYYVTQSHGSYKLGAKDSLIKKCGNYVANFQTDSSTGQAEAVIIFFYPDMLTELYKHETIDYLSEPSPISEPKKFISKELFEKYISNLYVYFDTPNLIDNELAALKLKELIMLLLRTENRKSVQAFLSELFSPNKLAFTTIVERNIFSNVTIDELAHITARSLSSFTRDFKKHYNSSPARYIKQRRLEHSAKLLVANNNPISSIAYDSGFVDPTTFSTAFHEKYACTPSA